MDNGLKFFIVFLIYTTGCTVSTEASYIRCYGRSINDYAEYHSSEIEKMMASSYFDIRLCTFMWLHGFNANENGPAITIIITGAINKGGWNVCLWNWVEESSASDLIGPEASYGVKVLIVIRLVGYELARALAKVADKGINLPCLHLYGHSLGAHVAGYAGKKLKVLGVPPIGRIIGVDPAGPLFEGLFSLGRALRAGDARSVDCFHCDAGNNGINSSNCDMDIWVNYYRFQSPNKTKRVQPGCPENYNGRFSEAALCSHNYCVKLLNASFVLDFFMSYGENYWKWARSNGTAKPITILGEKTDTTLRGNFYFSALGEWIYTLGMDGLLPYYY